MLITYMQTVDDNGW